MRRMLATEEPAPAPNEQTEKVVAFCLAAWIFFSIIFCALGGLRIVREPFPQLVMLGLFSVLLLIFAYNVKLSDWLMAIELRLLLVLHMSRFLGIYFFIAPSLSEMPGNFARLFGWFEFFLAWAVLVLLVWRARLNVQTFWKILLFWNFFGVGEILVFLIISTMIGIQQPGALQELSRLPLGLYFCCIFPVLALSHTIISLRFIRLITHG